MTCGMTEGWFVSQGTIASVAIACCVGADYMILISVLHQPTQTAEMPWICHQWMLEGVHFCPHQLMN